MVKISLSSSTLYSFSDLPLSPQLQRRRWLFVAMAALPVIGAFFCSQTQQTPPWACPLRYWTGIPCATCGMTRSFLALAQGEWFDAICFNLFGPLLFIGLSLTTLHYGLELLKGRQLTTILSQGIGNRATHMSLMIGLGLYNGIRLYVLSQSGTLGIWISESPLGHWLASL